MQNSTHQVRKIKPNLAIKQESPQGMLTHHKTITHFAYSKKTNLQAYKQLTKRDTGNTNSNTSLIAHINESFSKINSSTLFKNSRNISQRENNKLNMTQKIIPTNGETYRGRIILKESKDISNKPCIVQSNNTIAKPYKNNDSHSKPKKQCSINSIDKHKSKVNASMDMLGTTNFKNRITLVGRETQRHAFKENRCPDSNAATKQNRGDHSFEKAVLSTSNIILKDSNFINSTRNERLCSVKTSLNSDLMNKTVSFQKIFKASKSYYSPSEVMKDHGSELITYEKTEIMEYSEIYYWGNINMKMRQNSESYNNGFDDKKGFYLVCEGDHLKYQYEVLTLLGSGSFGQVFKCNDHKTKKLYAIKILRNKEKFHKQGKVEVEILEKLNTCSKKESQFIVKVFDHFNFRNHICIVFEILSIDLFELIKSSQFAGFTLPLVKAFARQIAVALDYIKRLNIIHCDLKPENILLVDPKKSAIKVIDFGTSCLENSTYYTYIQSRYYRAPEIMLGLPYNTAIDMWSFGCILAELFCGHPLFAGDDEAEQFAMIMEIRGKPSLKMLLNGTRTKTFFDEGLNPTKIVGSNGQIRIPGSKCLSEYLKTDSNEFIDFIDRCLEWDSDKRMKPIEAMNHPWLAQ